MNIDATDRKIMMDPRHIVTAFMLGILAGMLVMFGMLGMLHDVRTVADQHCRYYGHAYGRWDKSAHYILCWDSTPVVLPKADGK